MLRLPFFSGHVTDDAKDPDSDDADGKEGGGGGPSFSADCTRWRRGDRGGSALLGRGRVMGGEECSLAGKVCVVLELPTEWPAMGGGEDVVGDGVCASGDRGMFPADLQRDERYWRCSLGDRPCRELGRMCCDAAGEFGVEDAGELLWEDVPDEKDEEKSCRNVRGDAFLIQSFSF